MMERLKDWSWPMWLACCAAAALLGWTALPPEIAPGIVVQARRDVWDLKPLVPAAEVNNQALILASAPLWGPELKAEPTAPVEDTRWRLAGVFGHGKAGGVVLVFMDPAKKPQRLKVGEKVPSGETLESIEGSEVVLKSGRKRTRIGVEQSE